MAGRREEAGFTLIELVLIILLVTILAAAAIPRMADMTGVRASATARKLQSDIAYAQELAMTRNLRYRVYFNLAPAPTSGYAVVNDANGNGTWGEATEFAGDPAQAGANLSVTLNSASYAGVAISAVGFSNAYVEFNTLGVPFDGAGPLGAARTVTVSGGGVSQTVTVLPATGRVSSP